MSAALRFEEPAPFLDSQPPPLFARGLAWILIALFVSAALLASFVSVPEAVACRFVLAPVRGTDPVRAPYSGSLSLVPAAEGVHVGKGTVLYTIVSAQASDRSSELLTRQSELKGTLESLANSRRRYESESLAAHEDLLRLEERAAYLERMTQLKKEQLELTKEQAERARQLNEQGLASVNERSDALIRHSQTAMELEQLSGDRREIASQLEKLRHQEEVRVSQHREEERGLAEKVDAARIRIAALSDGLSGGSGGEAGAPRTDGTGSSAGAFVITAPCTGTVVRLSVRAVGAVVREGETLAEVACAGEKLQAELTVPQGGLARIQTGLPVKLLYDAFPYQRFGVKHGTVRWSGPPGVEPKESRDFRVFVEVAEQSVRVDGTERPLVAGMGGTARVIVGRRSALSYAFAPLRALRESLR